MGNNNLSLRAQVAWNATKHDGFVHWIHAPSRMSQIVHLCVKDLEIKNFLYVTKTYQFPTLFGYPLNPSNWFHKYIIGHSRLRYPYSAKQMNPFSVYCLFKGTSFIRAEYTFLQDSRSEERGLVRPILTYHGVFWRDCTFSTEPLAFRNIWDAIAICTILCLEFGDENVKKRGYAP